MDNKVQIVQNEYSKYGIKYEVVEVTEEEFNRDPKIRNFSELSDMEKDYFEYEQ
ncbi:MAG: hypothetical protein LBK12_06865 [Odoribacteraceae bacterium]|jgi:hypothetical protein|nr:hypothetical protein [Odoribacteraceae bacterium]